MTGAQRSGAMNERRRRRTGVNESLLKWGRENDTAGTHGMDGLGVECDAGFRFNVGGLLEGGGGV